MDPSQSFNQPPGPWNSSEKSGMLNPSAPPPPYQPSPVGYPPSYPSQPFPQSPYAQGQYPGQPVVAVQPTVFVATTPLSCQVPDYLAYSIFTMLCCCFPLGIAALIFSCSTRNAIYAGQRELAEKNSKTALTLNHAALGIGLILIVLVIIVNIVL
ncbi:cysteine-rich and transmembrane domain-containing protein YDL012C-like [Puntigrus tetrazona]|uniref:cysteine-rich and transmembrane domain-containing protein YDL012C-like n=1 Tax=Puntigrus tetrazona TaxID=1606681 RepID=UPI001C897BB5|nr:cysteine-rich and transmembrane domain-containing protein YDL012C-like [Puntigrus tetrazona]